MSRHKKIARRARRRRHARRHAGAISASTTVYSASAWWQDSDPSLQVIGLDRDAVGKKIRDMMDEEATEAYEDEMYDTMDDAVAALRWSGVHKFSLGTLVRDREMDEAKRELRDSGYYYPDMT